MIRAALIAVLFGMLLGGGEVVALIYPVLREQADDIRIMSADVHAIRQQFDLGMRMVGDGVDAAEAKPSVATSKSLVGSLKSEGSKPSLPRRLASRPGSS